jgi:hypothetical protein
MASAARGAAFAWLGVLAGFCAAPDAAAQVPGGEWHSTLSGRAFGTAIANAGDVDGDGADDLLVGEPLYYPTGGLTYEGRVLLYSGATQALIRAHDGTQAQEQLGTAMAGVGDLDLDGRDDYVIGSWLHSSNGWLQNGEVVAYSGSDGSVLWSVAGTRTNHYVGFSVAGVADVDGDLRSDVLVGDYNAEVVLYGASGAVIYTLTGQASSLFGYSLCGCGDLDGDGMRDFVIGAPYFVGGSPARNACGAAHAYSAATGTLLFSSLGDNVNDTLGRCVSSTGDVDGDGIDDLLAGSYGSPGNGSLSGMVRVASGASGATIRTTYGDGVNDRFGFSVVGMGDLDHDGVDDYAAGTPDGVTLLEGRVRAYSGVDGSVIHEWQGVTSPTGGNGDLGWSLAAGDFNDDGTTDLVIGDRSYSWTDPSSGQLLQGGGAFLYLGCPSYSDSYGAGWPGNLGIPTLVALSDPLLGASFDTFASNSAGFPTLALLLAGLSPAAIPYKDGTLLVTPDLLSLFFTLPTAGATFTEDVPDDPALAFLDLYAQVVESDPAASKKVSMSAGLHLRIGAN